MQVWQGVQCRSEDKAKGLVVGGVWHNNESAHARMVVEQSPQSGSTRQMLDLTNVESPLDYQSKSFEYCWHRLNKFKEEEGSSDEACVQIFRVEAPRAPPPPICQASGKRPQRAKQFVKAVQAQAQQAKPKAKQAPKPKFKPSGFRSKKRKKVPNPDDSGDESSPIPH